jgi:RNA polymerase sigma-70 factor (ECF subfamily)
MNRPGNSTGDMDRPPAAAGAPGGAGASAAPLPIPDDRALLERIRGGGHDGELAFRSLVDRHARYLFAVARSMTPRNEDAEDLVQDTLAAALQALASFRGESQVRTWLVAILVRRAAMMRRTQGRRIRPQSMSVVTDPEPAATSSQGASSRPPGAEAAATDARLDVAKMLEALSDEHRQVIVLRELEGMSYEQIATTLGVPRGTVESRLFRAREELRKRFKGYGV